MPDADTETDYQFVVRRKAELDVERQSHIAIWQDIAKFTWPKLHRINISGNETRGVKDTRQIVDFAGSQALNTCVAGFMAHITNPARIWFKRARADRIGENFHELDEWLDETTSIQSQVMLKSNLYTELRKLYTQYINFGTGAMIVLEDDEDTIRCETFSLGTYWIGINNKRRVDEFLRNPVMTVRRLVEEFGLENVSDWSKNAWNNGNFDQKVEILHWIGPNKIYDHNKVENKYKKYRELYVEVGDIASSGTQSSPYYPGTSSGKLLRESGYDDFPVICPRWDCDGEDAYGINYPGSIAVVAIKRLQQEVKDKLKGLAKQVAPPLNVPESQRRNTVTQDPNGMNFVDMRSGNDGIKPMYQVAYDIAGVSQDIAETKNEIGRIYYNHLFMMLANNRRANTKAAEIEALEDEKFSAIGPVLQQLNDELLDPLINRIDGICVRRGVFPPPPEDAQGREISIEYISTMAQAQKMVGIQAMDRFRAVVGEVAQFNPEAADIMDWDDHLLEYSRLVGVPAKTINSPETIDEKRQARAAAVAQRQQLAVQQSQADIAATLAKAKTDEDNALTQMQSQLRGGP